MSKEHDEELDETTIAINNHTIQVFHHLHGLHREMNRLQDKALVLAQLAERVSGLMVVKL